MSDIGPDLVKDLGRNPCKLFVSGAFSLEFLPNKEYSTL
jgi:hypothetical protein